MASILLIGVARGCLGWAPKNTQKGWDGLGWWAFRDWEPGLWHVNAIANVPACKVCPNAF